MYQDKIDRLISFLREEMAALPTNNVGSGNIAGTPEADPGNPPVRKKRKTQKYIFGKGYRKLWQKK